MKLTAPFASAAFALLLCFASPAALSAQAPSAQARLPQPFLALTRASVIDVRTGEIQRNATVVLRDGTIESIGTGAPPAGAEVVDLQGRYLLPGLMDAHSHVDDLSAARRALETGVTTLRSASVGSFRDVALREMAADGYIAGPDIIAAGLFVTPNLGEAVLADPSLRNLSGGVRTEEALRQLVRANLDHGVDVIKTRGTERAGTPGTDPRQQVYTEEQLRVVVEEAGTRGVAVMAHAHGDEGARAAVRAGVRSIEHGTYLSDSTLALMRERGTFLVPTYSTVVDLVEPGGDYDDPVTHARGMHMLPRLRRTVQAAHEMGITIVAGADAGYGPETITRISHEVANFVAMGMTPLEALQTATVNAAALFGMEDRVGRVEAGLEADLIVVEENPLEDPVALQDVLVVISNGRVGLNRLPFGAERRPVG